MVLLFHSYISEQINEVIEVTETLGLLNLLLMECLCSDQNDKLFPVSSLYINMGYDNINDPIRSCTLLAFIRLTISTFQGYTLYCSAEIVHFPDCSQEVMKYHSKGSKWFGKGNSFGPICNKWNLLYI